MNAPPAAHPRSLAQATALGFAAAVMLVPANLLPVLSTNMGGEARTDTIFSGIVGLWNDGMWAIATIVFIASIVIPILKLVGLAGLVCAVLRPRWLRRRRRLLTRLYAMLEFIGRWSMLDVFLVALLTGIVRFGLFATVEPRSGIVAFAAAVVLTVLATDAFNPRLLWPEPSSATAPDASTP